MTTSARINYAGTEIRPKTRTVGDGDTTRTVRPRTGRSNARRAAIRESLTTR